MRVAVIAGGDPGHVFPAAALTRALVGRGHDVVLCTGERWLPALTRDGIPAGPMPHPPANPEPDPVRRLKQTSRRLAPPIASSLAGFAPELVVADVMTPAGALAAALLGVPWVELVPHPVQDPSPFLPPAGAGMAPARGPLGRRRDHRFFRIMAPQWEQGRAGRRRAVERLDLDDARAGVAGDGSPLLRLVAALPALELPRPDWPADAHLVGPLEWDPAAGDLPLPPGDGPLVVLSATTVSGAITGLAAATLAGLGGAGLGGTGVRLAWTLLDPPPPGALPPWVSAGLGRQDQLIAAASVVVCGSGHGILAKALTRGVPVVTVPGGGEQRENAARVHRAGLGVRIAPSRLSPDRLAAAVRAVLADRRFAARAAACCPAPGARTGGDRSVDVLERAWSDWKSRPM